MVRRILHHSGFEKVFCSHAFRLDKVFELGRQSCPSVVTIQVRNLDRCKHDSIRRIFNNVVFIFGFFNMRRLIQVVDYDDHFNRLRQEAIRHGHMNCPAGLRFEVKHTIGRNRNDALVVDSERHIRLDNAILKHAKNKTLDIRIHRNNLADLSSSKNVFIHSEGRIANNRSFVLVDNLEHDNGIGRILAHTTRRSGIINDLYADGKHAIGRLVIKSSTALYRDRSRRRIHLVERRNLVVVRLGICRIESVVKGVCQRIVFDICTDDGTRLHLAVNFANLNCIGSYRRGIVHCLQVDCHRVGGDCGNILADDPRGERSLVISVCIFFAMVNEFANIFAGNYKTCSNGICIDYSSIECQRTDNIAILHRQGFNLYLIFIKSGAISRHSGELDKRVIGIFNANKYGVLALGSLVVIVNFYQEFAFTHFVREHGAHHIEHTYLEKFRPFFNKVIRNGHRHGLRRNCMSLGEINNLIYRRSITYRDFTRNHIFQASPGIQRIRIRILVICLIAVKYETVLETDIRSRSFIQNN